MDGVDASYIWPDEFSPSKKEFFAVILSVSDHIGKMHAKD